MPSKRSSLTVTSGGDAGGRSGKLGGGRRHALLGILGKRLEVDDRLLGQRLLQIRHRRLGGLAQEPERGLRLHVERHVSEAQDLRVLIEHRLAPDMHGGVRPERKKASLLDVHQQRDQQPVAGGRHDRLFDRGGE